MKLKELSQKIQLEIKEEELTEYLEVFDNLEKLLVNFQKIKGIKKFKPMHRIDVGSLTLSDLEKLKNYFSQQKVSKQTLQHNSKVDKDGFVLFRKIN